jgi:hypothetical protein
MKILRSVTRRGFNVGTAGWFSVLRPNTWFAASRLPDSRIRRYKVAASEHSALSHRESQQVVIPPPALTLSTPRGQPMRIALLVLASMGITSALLWWVMHP